VKQGGGQLLLHRREDGGDICRASMEPAGLLFLSDPAFFFSLSLEPVHVP
jgi:hypothetical protein